MQRHGPHFKLHNVDTILGILIIYSRHHRVHGRSQIINVPPTSARWITHLIQHNLLGDFWVFVEHAFKRRDFLIDSLELVEIIETKQHFAPRNFGDEFFPTILAHLCV